MRQSELWNWTYGTGLTELDFRTFGTGLTSISRHVPVEAGSKLFNPGGGMTKTPARHSLEHDSKIQPLMGSICERSMEREQKAQPGTPWNMTLRSTPFWGASAKGAWSADDAASSCGKAVAIRMSMGRVAPKRARHFAHNKVNKSCFGHSCQQRISKTTAERKAGARPRGDYQ